MGLDVFDFGVDGEAVVGEADAVVAACGLSTIFDIFEIDSQGYGIG